VPYDPSVLSLGAGAGLSLLQRVESTGSMRGTSPSKRPPPPTEPAEKEKEKEKERERAQRPTRPTRAAHANANANANGTGGGGGGGGGGKKEAPWKCLTIDTATVSQAQGKVRGTEGRLRERGVYVCLVHARAQRHLAIFAGFYHCAYKMR
jgi:hypothetical protein